MNYFTNLILHIWRVLRVCLLFVANFVINNVFVLLSGRLKLASLPRVNQTLLLAGKGKVFIGRNCSLGFKLGGFNKNGTIELQARNVDSIISLGDNVSTNNNVFICAVNSVEIGDDTLIGQDVTIMDHDAHCIEADKRREIGEIGHVVIGKNVWIGSGVMILKNTEIGNNTVVAAGSVVSGKFPENVVIGGLPAKIIKAL